jgi:hypothetical protein
LKSVAAKSARDEIDRMVDDLLADPTRVDDIKGELRRRLVGGVPAPKTLHAVSDVPAPPSRVPPDDDDLWENMPV